jgi:CRISPR-associated RAMP protein (TIGR02581 family)
MANDFKMFDVFDNRVRLVGKLTALTALRIGAGRGTGVTGTDLPVVRDAVGKPYIPGSSFKGSLRASVESLVRSVSRSRRAACNPLSRDEWCVQKPEGVDEGQFQKLVEEETCLVCRAFGSQWLASKVSVRDLLVEEEAWVDQYELRNGVAIDRDTGTAADRYLYDFEVVPAGTTFSCEIVAENADDWELGLLMIGLRPFERGEAVLGGARSRGLGAVKLVWDKQTRVAGGEELLDYLAGAELPPIDGLVPGWVGSFRDRLKGVANA